MPDMQKWVFSLTFMASFFALYVYTAGPSVLPYRDAGEMSTALPTLGIIHPTSYPAYSLLGKLVASMPVGNPGYRLNVFSALAMAAAWAVLFVPLSRIWGRLAAAATVLLAAVSYEFWWHAQVAEMYALNVLVLAALIWTWVRGEFLLFAFLFGVGLANRADLLLTAPAFAMAWWIQPERRQMLRDQKGWALLCVLAGLVLYFYLPLRAGQRPFMNWNDPSSLESFLGSLLRRGYGSGLDLLSQNYSSGENFLSQFKLYLIHLWHDYAYAGVALALLGLFALRRRADWMALTFGGWMITGPLFIWMGNLPPNTHAVAIMEAAYLAPDVFFLLAVAAGFWQCRQWMGRWVTLGMAVLLAAISAIPTYAQVNKRSHFLVPDLIRHVRLATPPHALIVSRKDVPLFSLYYGYWVSHALPFRIPIAQGLVNSPWYHRMMREQIADLSFSPLVTGSDWALMAARHPNRTLFGLNDMDWPSSGVGQFQGVGIANQWMREEASALERQVLTQKSNRLLRDIYVYRGNYRYGDYRDFFSNEMVEYYAKAWMHLQTEEALLRSWSLKPDWPYPPLQLGYLFFKKGDFARAERYYQESVRALEAYIQLGSQWRASPEMKKNLESDLKVATMHLEAAQAMLKGK